MHAANLLEQVMYGKSPNAKVASLLSLQYFNPYRNIWESFGELSDDHIFEFTAWDARMGEHPEVAYGQRYGGRATDPYYGFKPSVWRRAKNWLRKHGWLVPVIAASIGTGAYAQKVYLDKFLKDKKYELLQNEAMMAFLDIINDEINREAQVARVKSLVSDNKGLQTAFASLLGKLTKEESGSKKGKTTKED